ncbi:ATP-dependent Clp protease ATP-binding subunit [Bacillus bombysepticus]|uniref:ATP-dependent Clp protease ATP-binding subunit n=1 Tax=Bacillus bombysepticus TaxID=658666 RepID=UPI00301A4487
MLELCEVCDLVISSFRILPETEKMYSVCMDCLKRKIEEGAVTYQELGESIVVELIESNPLIPEKKVGVEATSKEMLVKKFAKELTANVEEQDPIIGRMKEVSNLIRVLGRKGKNNPVLVGEPGVGKTAIVEGLAQRIARGDVPEYLNGKRIFSLEMSSLVAGTKLRGEFEERIKGVIDEVVKAGDIILFIDEMHTMIGAGASEGGMDVSNVLKPALSRGTITVIGATTEEEYRKYIEKDAAFERRFQKTYVEEPTKEEVLDILRGIRMYYEKHHCVLIEDEVLEKCVEWSEQHVKYRKFPDKAIDLLDESCVYVKMENLYNEELQVAEQSWMKAHQAKKREIFWMNEEGAKKYYDQEKMWEQKLGTLKKTETEEMFKVGIEHVAHIISEWTGIEVQQVNQGEKERLKKMGEILKRKVIGQDQAVDSMVKAIRRNRMGMKSANRPVGVFAALGPSGTGKTYLAEQIAKELYGSEKRILRFDMSEYMDKTSVGKLIGTAPGYVGYQEGGRLTKLLQQSPNSVVLLDEIEKAHPEIFTVFLQLFENGHLMDHKGRKIDGTHALFILTSNIGSDEVLGKKRGMSFIEPEINVVDNVQSELKNFLPIELINRLDEVLVFQPLSNESYQTIAKLMLNEWRTDMEERGVGITFHGSVFKFILENEQVVHEGARSFRKHIRNMQDKLIEYMLEEEKDNYRLSVKQGEYIVR